MNKASRILDDVIFIIAVIIFPYFLLKILGFERMMCENEIWVNFTGQQIYNFIEKQMCPTLGIDDLEFIKQKANELFDKERD